MRRSAAIAFTLLAWISARALAQGNDASVTFDAASVKPYPEGTPVQMSGCQGGPGSDDPGRVRCEYATLRMLVAKAYQVNRREIFGPAWIDTAHFDLTATVARGATKEQAAAMLRNLLADRFKVALHHENRELPGYALVVAKNGLKIKESVPASAGAAEEQSGGGRLPMGKDGFPVLRRASIAGGPIILYREGRARLQAANTKLARLAESLSYQLDKVVMDETGVTGTYDITLYWTPEADESGGRPRPAAAPGALPEAGAPDATLFQALEDQLGLKLQARKIPRDTLVIDRAEKVPVEN